MIIIPMLLTLCFFGFGLYLMLRYGSDIPKAPFLLLWVVTSAVLLFGDSKKIIDFPLVLLSMFIGFYLAFRISFLINRRKAGNLILTYKRSKSNVSSTVVGIVFVLIMALILSFPNEFSYPGNKPIFDEDYYYGRLPFSIFAALTGLSLIPTIFRKGEFFDGGIATPDLQYYPWNGYKSYAWIKNDNQRFGDFSLCLKGGRSGSYIIHGFSEDSKEIVEKTVLQTKYPLPN